MSTGESIVGGGRCLDGSDRIEVKATNICLSRPWDVQKPRSMLNASDEFAGTGTHLVARFNREWVRGGSI